MNILFILSTFAMYFICKSYNLANWFENFWVDVCTQMLHIITLNFILSSLLTSDYIIIRILSLFCMYTIWKCIKSLAFTFIDNNEDEDRDKQDDDDTKKER